MSNFNAEVLLLIFVGVAACAFVIQSISIWLASRAVRRTVEAVQEQTDSLESEIQSLTDKLNDVTESLKPVADLTEEFNNSARSVLELFRERSQDVDQLIQELVQVGREQASKVDYIVTDTAEKFEQTTDVIQERVVNPAIEISSFLKGIWSGLDYFFAKKPDRSEERSQSEEELLN